MATETQRLTEERVRRLFPHLSDAGVRAAVEPTRYAVEYIDNPAYEAKARLLGLDPEHNDTYDELDYWRNFSVTLEAETLKDARRVGEERLKIDPFCQARIIERKGVERENTWYRQLCIPSWTVEDYDVIEEL